MCENLAQAWLMSSVSTKLKELREKAQPKLTIRGMAEALGIPSASYNFYERAAYKKPTLPLDLTRRIAAILSERNVDPAEVMKLAGLNDTEAFPEAREIDAARPQVQFFTVQAVMPSEAALAAMFETLLALIPPEATRAEAARILAQRLPTGFAAIGPGVVELSSDEEIGDASLLPTHATGRRGPARP